MGTPTIDPAPSETKAELRAPERPVAAGQPFFHKPVLILYRVFAIIVLYAVLGGVIAYAFVMGFYAVNSSWAAPVILSA